MRIRRIPAEQAHQVPKRAYYAGNIFDPAITTPNRVVVNEGPIPDDGGGYHPLGSTAQNGFREVKWYRCEFCGELLRETHVEGHKCEVNE